jgi:hypothetical protein
LHHLADETPQVPRLKVPPGRRRGLVPLRSAPFDAQFRVAFVFEREPTTSLRHWLADVHAQGMVDGPAPRFIEAARGSYIEFFWMSAQTLMGVLIGLGLIERVVDRPIYIRARTEVLASQKLPPAVRRRALQPIAATSQGLCDCLQ